jgi:hypothetical protein
LNFSKMHGTISQNGVRVSFKLLYVLFALTLRTLHFVHILFLCVACSYYNKE